MPRSDAPRIYVTIEPKVSPHAAVAGPSVSAASLSQARAELARGALKYSSILAALNASPPPSAGDAAELEKQRVMYAASQATLTKRILDGEKAQASFAKNPPPAPAAPSPAAPMGDLSLKVLSLEYEEDEKKVDKAVLTLDNSDLSYFDHVIFEKGTRLRLSWGYAGRMSPIRAVVVQKVTGALQLKVEAQGAGVLMNKVARTRTYENTTRSELVHALAKENGFGDSERFIEETTRMIPVQTQSGMTDFQFLKRLAGLEGFEFFIDFDGLHWHPRRLGQKPVKEYQYYLPPLVGDILNFDIDNDVTAKPGAAKVAARDPLKKTDVTATGSDKTTPRSTLAAITDLFGSPPPDGKANQKATASAALPGEVLEVDPRTGSTKTVIKTPDASGDVKNAAQVGDVKKQADATFKLAQQAVVKLKLDLVGDPHLVAKTVIKVSGLGQRLSGKYYISTLKHSVSAGGYKMEAATRTDGTNKGTPTAGSKAAPNTKDADKKTGPGADTLTETRVVDPRTGSEKTVFKDTRGRES